MGSRALDIAATGAATQQLYVDVISQNLANLNTTGYKLQRPEFQDLLYQNLRRVGSNSSDSGTIVPTGIQLGLGAKTGSIYRNHKQGVLQSTEGTLDVAIQGKGFFQITMPSGEIGYTRDGTFQLSPTGEIVNFDGYPLSPSISIPQNAVSISINKSGEVAVTLDGQVTPQVVGQMQLATFLNDNGLQAIGGNMFTETAASGSPTLGNPNVDGVGNLQQGFLESSNVDQVVELTNLIRAQRAYDNNLKIISRQDQMMQTATQAVG